MKDILIVYPNMTIGGSTTSLLSILNLFDYMKYHIDLLLGENEGDLLKYIPKEVNLLEQALPSKKCLKIKKMFSVKYHIARHKAKSFNSMNIKHQYMNFENARMSRRVKKSYDIAIAFLETYCCDYVAEYVDAKKKIFWLHLDYKGAGFVPEFDIPIYSKFNSIVLVSKQCKENFDDIFPELKSKSIVIENILSKAYMLQRAKESIDFDVEPGVINLVSVCRIEFKHKGLDRGIEGLRELKKKGITNIHWYIIGDGSDYNALLSMIHEYNLTDQVHLLGKKINPAPYITKMDGFFLPSRYEGKPMAVTEAMLLGIPCFVANYASAAEQINSMIDGIISENSQLGINRMLEFVAKNSEQVMEFKNVVKKMDLTNTEEMIKIDELLSEN